MGSHRVSFRTHWLYHTQSENQQRIPMAKDRQAIWQTIIEKIPRHPKKDPTNIHP